MKKVIPLTAIVLSQLLASCAQNSTKVATKSATREPTSEAEEAAAAANPWTTWSKKGMIGGLYVLSGIRKQLLEGNLHDPHVDYSGYKEVDCSEQNTKYRSADGTCNDVKNPHAGAAGVAFGRNVPPEFIDHEAEQKLMTPNPAEISKVLFTRDEFKPVPFLNMLAASWIQFMNHDWLTHGPNEKSRPHIVHVNGGEDRVVDRTQENRSSQEKYKKNFGKVTLNDVTHWWDGSQIYGSSQPEQNALRSFSQGKMATVMVNGREVLPKAADLNIASNRQNQGHELTGFRDNWWAGLSMLHHLFVKEHNAIANMLIMKHAKYDKQKNEWIWKENGSSKRMTDKEFDEHVFQVARLINAAVMAKIHTVEWTPAILANDVLKKAMYTNWYGLANPQTWSSLIKHIPGFNRTDWFSGTNTGYTIGGIVGDKTNNYGVPFSITEEFTSVYRLHSLLPEKIHMKKVSRGNVAVPVAFAETRNEKSYDIMTNTDLKDLFYTFGTQNPGQLVLNNFPKFMQEFTIPGHGKMDLAMVDVMRDRERGVPRYNQFRRAIGLKAISSYSDFFDNEKPLDARQKKILENFTRIYGKTADGKDNVEMIDLLVGTSAEEVRPKNFGFGETMFQIFIVMASRRLMADRFFTTNYRKEYYTQAGLDWIDNEGWFSKVIVRHMPELKPKVEGLETAFNPWKN